MPEGYMSVSDAAAAIGISVTALYDRIRNGQVKAERVGRRVLLIPQEEVERLRGKGRMKPGPKPREETPAERRQEVADHDEALDAGRRRIRGEPEPDAPADAES
jgi:excisionase family DNA binding protein